MCTTPNREFVLKHLILKTEIWLSPTNMWILYFKGSSPMMCDREAMAPESGSKFKFGFPQLPTKFITLMYSPRTSFGISYFHCVQTYKDTIYSCDVVKKREQYFSQIIGQHWAIFYQSNCKKYIYSTKFKSACDYLLTICGAYLCPVGSTWPFLISM